MSMDVRSARHHVKRHDRNSIDAIGACSDVERLPIASVIAKAPSLEGYQTLETRRECGQLIARLVSRIWS